MLLTAQAPCYGFGMKKYTLRKREIKQNSIKLWRLKNDKIKKAVKDQVNEITALSKSYNDWSKNIFRVVAKLCCKSKGDQRQKTSW